MQKTRIVNPQKRFLLYYFNIDFRVAIGTWVYPDACPLLKEKYLLNLKQTT